VISEPIGSERCVLIVGRNHPLAVRQAVEPEELERFPFVGAPESSLFGQSVERMLRAAGIRRITIVSRATEYQVLRQLVIAGVGIACTVEKRVPRDVAAGELAILPLRAPPLTIGVRLLRSTGEPASPALGSLIAQIRACWQQGDAPAPTAGAATP